jgi:hypothetical protein
MDRAGSSRRRPVRARSACAAPGSTGTQDEKEARVRIDLSALWVTNIPQEAQFPLPARRIPTGHPVTPSPLAGSRPLLEHFWL